MSAYNAGDPGLIPGSGRFYGEENGNLLKGLEGNGNTLQGREDPLQKESTAVPTPVLLPGRSHGRRIVVGYSPWGRKESDTTERLHFSLSFVSIWE